MRPLISLLFIGLTFSLTSCVAGTASGGSRGGSSLITTEELEEARTDAQNLYAVIERLRADKNLKGLRILVASSKPFDNDKLDAQRVGADDYLVKPFKKAELIEKVKALINGK